MLHPDSQGGLMRTFGIWVFGILASAIIGGLIGSRMDDRATGDLETILGILAGVFTFACVRLWLGQRD
jgi:uncharacterized protein YcfJ